MPALEAALLGTTVRLRGVGAARVLAEMRRLEALLTRFRASPLTHLNRTGVLEHPPAELTAALRHALRIARATRGLVTPTVLGALQQVGYGEPSPARPLARGVPDARRVRVSAGCIRLAPEVGLDLGGTAKTWIASRASARFRGDFVLDAGGDVLLSQRAPVSVSVAHPFGDPPLALDLPAGRWGVATSSVLTRVFPGGTHLIDPRTGRPLRSRLVQVTVAARQLTVAEVLTKLAFLDEAELGRLARRAVVLAYERSGRALLWGPGGFGPLREAA